MRHPPVFSVRLTPCAAGFLLAVYLPVLSTTIAHAQVDIPTRPGTLQPLVELQINNTATQKDDYVGNVQVRGRVRVVPPYPDTTPIPVILTNARPSTVGMVAFINPITGTRSSTLKLTLPTTGTWQSFRLIGARLSALDKDAIIEVREDRPDGTVLGRRGLAVLRVPGLLQASPVQAPSATTPAVEIAVARAETTLDDYITWSPTRLSIRQRPAATALTVIVRNMPGSGQRLRFGPHPATLPAGSTVTAISRSVSLPANGAWVTISVAGAFGAPSLRDKDGVVEVMRRGVVRPVVREGLMVRVRRNADSLASDARSRFLRALATINLQADQYNRMQHFHRVGLAEAHGLSGFLPWHRVFVLELERMLQAIDPSVALHYWRFDLPAPNLFNTAFIGVPPAGSSVVQFDAGNPLSLWQVADAAEFGGGIFTGVLRRPTYPPTGQASLSDETTTLGLGTIYAQFDNMEGNPHGNAHVATGGSGNWLNNVTISVRDPLFFLLHCNVDRLWAKWQWVNGRFSPTSSDAYTQQTPNPGSCPQHRSYVNGPLWPWSGATSPGDPCRPAQAPSGPLRRAVTTPSSPPQPPRPADVIDFRYAAGLLGNGFAYDDVPHN
jgi:tyrosinase